MADLVDAVLQAASDKASSYKTTNVDKAIDVDVDAGNLLLIDNNKIETIELRSQKEEYLKNLARDDTQLLLNKIWQLPVERVQDAIVVMLPDGTTRLPREKPIPKPKAATRWQEYSKLKSVHKRKEGRMVWDEQTKDWKPRWGYKRAGDDTKEWMIEVPQNADPFEDQFEKKTKAKREKVAKNDLQRMRNISRNMKGKLPSVGVTPAERGEKGELARALAVTHKATASMGKFTGQLANEKPLKNVGKRRTFEMNTGNPQAEKDRALRAIEQLRKKAPILDARRAANTSTRQEQEARGAQKRSAEESGDGKWAKKQGGKMAKSGNRGNRKSSKKGTPKSGKKNMTKKR